MNNSSFSFCVIRLLCSLRTLTLSFYSVMLSRSPNRWLKVNRSLVGRHETMVGQQSKQRKSISSDILNRLFGFPPARCVYSSAVCVCVFTFDSFVHHIKSNLINSRYPRAICSDYTRTTAQMSSIIAQMDLFGIHKSRPPK